MSSRIFKPNSKLLRKLYALIGVWTLIGLISIGVIALPIGLSEGGATGGLIAMVATVFLNLAWVIPAMLVVAPYFRSIQYEIREDEVIVRIGIITKSVKHVPFRTVTNLKVNQGPFDRLFGLGTVEIQTAGMSGQSGAEERMIGLSDFQETYEEIATAIRRFRGGMSPTQAEEEPVGSQQELLAAILEELRSLRTDMSKQQDH